MQVLLTSWCLSISIYKRPSPPMSPRHNEAWVMPFKVHWDPYINRSCKMQRISFSVMGQMLKSLHNVTSICSWKTAWLQLELFLSKNWLKTQEGPQDDDDDDEQPIASVYTKNYPDSKISHDTWLGHLLSGWAVSQAPELPCKGGFFLNMHSGTGLTLNS